MHNLYSCLEREGIENEYGGKYRAEAPSKNTCHESLAHKVTVYPIALCRDMTKATHSMRDRTRIGLILSALWLLGFGGWQWIRSAESIDRSYFTERDNCGRIASTKIGPILSDDPEREQKTAAFNREYDACRKKVGEFVSQQKDELRSRIWLIVAVDVGLLVLFWSIAWGAVAVVRWVTAGFRQQA